MKVLTLESALDLLDSDPNYKVLRKFKPRTLYNPISGAALRRGVYIDCETDSAETDSAVILELAIVPFLYEESGTIVSVLVDEAQSFLNDPGHELSDETRKLTGIADEDLKGKHLDLDIINTMLVNVDLAVAHNASFDRRIGERFVPAFRNLRWACSQHEVPWRNVFRAPGERLEVLVHFLCDAFYHAHRAMADCLVGLHLLATATDDEGRSAFSYMLESAQSESIRIWAVGAPFHVKDDLKARGYRWNDGKDGRPKAWHKRIPPDKLAEENVWLRTVAGAYPEVTTTEAIDRYSIREG